MGQTGPESRKTQEEKTLRVLIRRDRMAKGRSSDFSGKGKDLDISKVSKAQLRAGIAIEMEHTKNPTIAKKIALDHLAENPRYYTYLKKMERQMKIDALKQKQKQKPAPAARRKR